jgi:hypothetical protein
MTIGKIASSLVLALVVSACATTTRLPVTDVPAGTYVLVEPASDEYNAVTISENAFAVRMGDMTHSGQHWLDSEGRLHMTDDAGPCAGVESIWTYQYSGNRVTLDLVEDLCTERPSAFPERLVYERR